MPRSIALPIVLASVCAAASVEAAPSRRVFAYATGTTQPARWDLVSDVAWFSETMGTGVVLPTTGWSSDGKALVAAGHAQGVKVHLTVRLFNPSTTDEIHAFLSSATAVSAGTTAIVDAVKAEGGDGVNIDFDFVSSGDKAAFTSFVQGLAQSLHAAVPGAELSLAMPSEAYPGYDLAALGAAADLLMIMGYDYHWATSDPGPVAPLASSTTWGATHSEGYSIGLFEAAAPPAKIVMGMPLYGYDYEATSSAVPGTHVAGTTAVAVRYKTAETEAPVYGRQ